MCSYIVRKNIIIIIIIIIIYALFVNSSPKI